MWETPFLASESAQPPSKYAYSLLPTQELEETYEARVRFRIRVWVQVRVWDLVNFEKVGYEYGGMRQLKNYLKYFYFYFLCISKYTFSHYINIY